MSLIQLLGAVLLCVAAFYAWRWLRGAWRARATSATHAGHDAGWADTRPRDQEGRTGSAAQTAQDFSDDTAPAVLSMPFGLDDNEPPPAPRERGRRRAS